MPTSTRRTARSVWCSRPPAPPWTPTSGPCSSASRTTSSTWAPTCAPRWRPPPPARQNRPLRGGPPPAPPAAAGPGPPAAAGHALVRRRPRGGLRRLQRGAGAAALVHPPWRDGRRGSAARRPDRDAAGRAGGLGRGGVPRHERRRRRERADRAVPQPVERSVVHPLPAGEPLGRRRPVGPGRRSRDPTGLTLPSRRAALLTAALLSAARSGAVRVGEATVAA